MTLLRIFATRAIKFPGFTLGFNARREGFQTLGSLKQGAGQGGGRRSSVREISTPSTAVAYHRDDARPPAQKRFAQRHKKTERAFLSPSRLREKMACVARDFIEGALGMWPGRAGAGLIVDAVTEHYRVMLTNLTSGPTEATRATPSRRESCTSARIIRYWRPVTIMRRHDFCVGCSCGR